MTDTVEAVRPFIPGTTGWTVHDLDDPQIERLWNQGRYEIVEGVLAKMPPALFSGGNALFNLLFILRSHMRDHKLPGRFATEVDITLSESRVVVADAALLIPDDLKQQAKAIGTTNIDEGTDNRLLAPPTLIIEAVSAGHEAHDTKLKKKWYLEFGVPNYWILDPGKKTLQCFSLKNGTYLLDSKGSKDDLVKPKLFPGLSIELHRVWND
jgi:Uma2 family endonuclease